jgi:hypothetical protein
MDSDLFPLRTIGDVRTLFERHLKRDSSQNIKMAQSSKHSDDVINGEPNLVLLSIVAGSIENNMTMAKTLTSMFGSDTDPGASTTATTNIDDQVMAMRQFMKICLSHFPYSKNLESDTLIRKLFDIGFIVCFKISH